MPTGIYKRTKWHIERLKSNRVGMKGKKHSKSTKLKLSKHPNIRNNHNAYKGENITYYTLHGWIAEQLGIPKKCSRCGIKNKPAKDGRRTIHWHNKGHIYKRTIKGWKALCYKCHGEENRKEHIRE